MWPGILIRKWTLKRPQKLKHSGFKLYKFELRIIPTVICFKPSEYKCSFEPFCGIPQCPIFVHLLNFIPN